eukprot:SAG25_NODE_2913_length_1317_cov_0.991790_1_plen_49_part_10
MEMLDFLCMDPREVLHVAHKLYIQGGKQVLPDPVVASNYCVCAMNTKLE